MILNKKLPPPSENVIFSKSPVQSWVAWIDSPIWFIIIIKPYKLYFFKYAHTRTYTIKTCFYRFCPVLRKAAQVPGALFAGKERT